jgi:hypothetical protein
MNDRKAAGAWTAVGVGVGVAIGAATHSLAFWTAIGVAVGAVVGFVLDRQRRNEAS